VSPEWPITTRERSTALLGEDPLLLEAPVGPGVGCGSRLGSPVSRWAWATAAAPAPRPRSPRGVGGALEDAAPHAVSAMPPRCAYEHLGHRVHSPVPDPGPGSGSTWAVVVGVEAGGHDDLQPGRSGHPLDAGMWRPRREREVGRWCSPRPPRARLSWATALATLSSSSPQMSGVLLDLGREHEECSCMSVIPEIGDLVAPVTAAPCAMAGHPTTRRSSSGRAASFSAG